MKAFDNINQIDELALVARLESTMLGQSDQHMMCVICVKLFVIVWIAVQILNVLKITFWKNYTTNKAYLNVGRYVSMTIQGYILKSLRHSVWYYVRTGLRSLMFIVSFKKNHFMEIIYRVPYVKLKIFLNKFVISKTMLQRWPVQLCRKLCILCTGCDCFDY